MRFASSAALLLLCLCALPVSAQIAPERGTALRSAILDGLRAGIDDVPGLERDVLFRVHKLAVLDDYALATVSPMAPGGDPIYEYEKDLPCDLEIVALLHVGEEGWRVVERDVGPCDYIWRSVFEHNPDYPTALLRFWEGMDTSD